MGDAHLGDAANTHIMTADGNDFVMRPGVTDQLARGVPDQPAMGGSLADITSRDQNSLVRKTGQQQAPQFMVFLAGDFRIEAVNNWEFPWLGSGRHDVEAGQ